MAEGSSGTLATSPTSRSCYRQKDVWRRLVTVVNGPAGDSPTGDEASVHEAWNGEVALAVPGVGMPPDWRNRRDGRCVFRKPAEGPRGT